ncbi:MAG: helix-turn-helix transcriptional regulator [Candidatus Thorarchaeota archaeon]|nr:MAG: helix-turn-helix transcriptional regulator [Candidatus Thorarchaeota archaeon]
MGKPKTFSILPPTYLAVLSLVGAGAKYGYEINQILEHRGYRSWVDIKMSSVYKALNELEKRGLISGRKLDKGLQPAKKTYVITSKGRKELKRQVTRSLSNPPQANTMFDLGMSAIWALTESEALNALRTYRDHLERAVGFLAANVEGIVNIDELARTDPKRMVGGLPVSEIDDRTNLPIVRALFERPLTVVRAQRDYLNKLIVRVETGEEKFPFRKEK